MTLPLILTINVANRTDRTRLLEILGGRDERILCIDEVCTIIHKYGGFTDARKRAEQEVKNAFIMLNVFSGKNNSLEHKVLEGLARYVLYREK